MFPAIPRKDKFGIIFNTTGNWLAWRHNDTIQSRTHNPANEIVSIDNSDVCVRTDAAGNMTRIPNPKAGIVRADYSSVFCVTRRFAAPRRVEPESLNLTYDAWNRLVRVTKPAGNLVAEYRYDGLNRRVLKTTSCETRRFYYNRNWQCVQETVEDQPTTHYTWGLRYVDDLVCRHTDTTPIYSLADANWNVAALTDAAGTPVERYTYTAFGKLNIYDDAFTPRSASNYNWTRTFTGQVLDHETGVMLYRNRYYTPDLGRFITRDPIGFKGDFCLYRYGLNEPIYALDPEGNKIVGQNCSECFGTFQSCQFNVGAKFAACVSALVAGGGLLELGGCTGLCAFLHLGAATCVTACTTGLLFWSASTILPRCKLGQFEGEMRCGHEYNACSFKKCCREPWRPD